MNKMYGIRCLDKDGSGLWEAVYAISDDIAKLKAIVIPYKYWKSGSFDSFNAPTVVAYTENYYDKSSDKYEVEKGPYYKIEEMIVVG